MRRGGIDNLGVEHPYIKGKCGRCGEKDIIIGRIHLPYQRTLTPNQAKYKIERCMKEMTDDGNFIVDGEQYAQLLEEWDPHEE